MLSSNAIYFAMLSLQTTDFPAVPVSALLNGILLVCLLCKSYIIALLLQ